MQIKKSKTVSMGNENTKYLNLKTLWLENENKKLKFLVGDIYVCIDR